MGWGAESHYPVPLDWMEPSPVREKTVDRISVAQDGDATSERLL